MNLEKIKQGLIFISEFFSYYLYRKFTLGLLIDKNYCVINNIYII